MKKPNNFWRNFLWENSRWLLASLLLAFGLWVLAVFQTDPVERRTYSRLVPIEFMLDNEMLITEGQVNEGALVTIRAPRAVWESLRLDQIEIQADLRGRSAGLQRVDLRGALSNGLRGEVVDISPRWIEVTLEALVSRRLPIIPLVVQEPPIGFTYPAPTCSLSEVTATGPASALENAGAVARLNLQDLRNPTTLTVALEPSNSLGRPRSSITLETTQVECTVTITPIDGVSELSVVPIVEGFPPSGYIYEGFDFTPRTVIVTGNPSAISSMNGIVNTEAINLRDATGDFEHTANVILPNGVRLLPETQTIAVTIQIGTIQGNRQFADIPIQVEGLRSELTVRLSVETVTVFAVGPRPLLETLTANDLRVVVDLADNQVGTYQEPAIASIVLAESAQEVQLTVQPPEIGLTIAPLDPLPTQEP
jgi:YbbR domain-containing protein